MRKTVSKLILISVWVAIAIEFCGRGYAQDTESAAVEVTFAGPETLSIRNTFHIAGIRSLKRNGRGDLELSARTFKFYAHDRDLLNIPFNRITKVQLGDAQREYAKTAYAAVLVFGAPGALVLAKKRHVDSLTVDFQNEHGGLESVVLQVPRGDGARCKEWLTRYGVKVEDPPESAWLDVQK